VGQWQKLLSTMPTPSQSDSSLIAVVGGGGGGAGGGPLYVASEKNLRIAKVHSITSRFGPDDLVKTKLYIEVHEKNKGKAFYYS
jgi:hypothetical protein